MKRPDPMILVVDDDALVRELLADALSGAGLRVAQAHGVESALSRLLAEAAAVLVTDFNMGDGTAFDLIDRARKEKVIPPVIALVSGTYDINEATRSKKGITAYFQKPLDIDDLVRFCAAAQGRASSR